MNFARFFVTLVMPLVTVISIGCNGKKAESKADPARTATLKAEVKAKWDETDVIGEGLKQNYRIMILDEPMRMNSRSITMVDSRTLGLKYHWGRLTLAERRLAKEKLALFVTAISRVIAIDAKRGLSVTNMDKVQSRYQGALAFQESLMTFEKLAGEQYEPKNPGQAPIYFPPIDI
jgi:hypothetical protein